jgi:hypothetical protein
MDDLSGLGGSDSWMSESSWIIKYFSFEMREENRIDCNSETKAWYEDSFMIWDIVYRQTVNGVRLVSEWFSRIPDISTGNI